MKSINMNDPFKIRMEKRLVENFKNLPYVYIRIPRTGSTSISIALSQTTKAHPWPHFSANILRNIVGTSEFEKKTIFTSVRNPWDRLVSWFYFSVDHPSANPNNRKNYSSLGFKNWILKGCPFEKHRPHHFAHQPENPVCQFSWICDENQNVIVDHVIRLENIEEDFGKIIDKMGIKSINIPKLNVSKKRKTRDYRKYYDEETKNKVAEMFKKDVEYFGYKF